MTVQWCILRRPKSRSHKLKKGYRYKETQFRKPGFMNGVGNFLYINIFELKYFHHAFNPKIWYFLN